MRLVFEIFVVLFMSLISFHSGFQVAKYKILLSDNLTDQEAMKCMKGLR